MLDRDTIIDGKLYRNLSFWKVSYYYRKFGFVIDTTYQDVKIADAGAVRTTADGKIYYRSYGNFDLRSVIFADYSEQDTLPINKDVLFYDFSVTIEDTVYNPVNNYRYGVVDSISFLEIAGQNRKVLWIACESYGNELWIEGIGSLKGFFSSCVLTEAEYGGGYLSCYEEKGMGTITISGLIRDRPFFIYQKNNSYQNFLTNITSVHYNPPDIKLYHVPTTDWLRVEYPTDLKINLIQVVNFLGQQVNVPFQDDRNGLLQININPLPTGTYVLLLQSDRQILTGKFVKQ